MSCRRLHWPKGQPKVISKRLAKIIQKLPATSTRGLPREFQFYIGMSVMVTRNLFTELGITNGTTGVIKSVHFKDEVELIDDAHIGLIDLDQQPLYIVVELKDINMEALEGLPANHVPIYPQTESIQVRIPKKNTKASFTRRQFPLVPRFSCTAHKSQGQTLSKAIVDLEPIRNRRNPGIEHSYVPLSRVKRLQDLTLLRPVQASVLRARVNKNVASMMEDFKSRDLCKNL